MYCVPTFNFLVENPRHHFQTYTLCESAFALGCSLQVCRVKLNNNCSHTLWLENFFSTILDWTRRFHIVHLDIYVLGLNCDFSRQVALAHKKSLKWNTISEWNIFENQLSFYYILCSSIAYASASLQHTSAKRKKREQWKRLSGVLAEH